MRRSAETEGRCECTEALGPYRGGGQWGSVGDSEGQLGSVGDNNAPRAPERQDNTVRERLVASVLNALRECQYEYAVHFVGERGG